MERKIVIRKRQLKVKVKMSWRKSRRGSSEYLLFIHLFTKLKIVEKIEEEQEEEEDGG